MPEDRSVSIAAANGYALAVFVPLVALLAVPFGLLWGWRALGAGFLWWLDRPLTLLGALAGGVLVHEVLHAAAWRRAAGVPAEAVGLGFQWKTLTPYAHCTEPMPVRAYRVGAATPGLALGLAPIVAATVIGSGPLLAFGLFFLFAAGGDALILWLLRDVPGDRLVEDHPTRAGCYVLAPDHALGEEAAEPGSAPRTVE